MIHLLADEDFNGRIVRGVLRVRPDADIVRVQDTVIYEAPDPKVLEWAAQEGRIVLTHDVNTMVGFANERIRLGLPMPGVIVVRIVANRQSRRRLGRRAWGKRNDRLGQYCLVSPALTAQP